jgi:hypothetical protein
VGRAERRVEDRKLVVVLLLECRELGAERANNVAGGRPVHGDGTMPGRCGLLLGAEMLDAGSKRGRAVEEVGRAAGFAGAFQARDDRVQGMLLAGPLLNPDVLGAHRLAGASGERLLTVLDEVDEAPELLFVLGQEAGVDAPQTTPTSTQHPPTQKLKQPRCGQAHRGTSNGRHPEHCGRTGRRRSAVGRGAWRHASQACESARSCRAPKRCGAAFAGEHPRRLARERDEQLVLLVRQLDRPVEHPHLPRANVDHNRTGAHDPRAPPDLRAPEHRGDQRLPVDVDHDQVRVRGSQRASASSSRRSRRARADEPSAARSSRDPLRCSRGTRRATARFPRFARTASPPTRPAIGEPGRRICSLARRHKARMLSMLSAKRPSPAGL